MAIIDLDKTATQWCTKCGAELDPAWAFCVSCATAVPKPQPEAQAEMMEPATMPEPVMSTAVVPMAVAGAPADAGPGLATRLLSTRSRRLLVSGIAAIALVGATTAHIGVRSDLRNTKATLVRTQSDLASTKAQLKSTQSDLTESKAALKSMTGDRDGLRTRLDAATSELEGVRGSLNSAESRLNLQAGQISTLKTCLRGVSNALTSVADEDYSSAIAALDSVDVACNEAFNLF